MTELDQLVAIFHRWLYRKHNTKAIKLLNVGSDNHKEYHWRFRKAGQIFNISITLED